MIGLPQRLGLKIDVYERGTNGVPTTTFVEDLAGRADRYDQAIDHHIGFESMTVSFPCTLEDALDWLSFGLMRSVIVTGPDVGPKQSAWEGFLETVEAQIGGEQRSVSVREMANRIRVQYQTVLGTTGARPTTSTFFEDTASEALYGKKDLVLALGNTTDGAEVDDYGNAMLAKLKNPLAAPSSQIASGDLGEIRLTLTFAGWYTTLGNVLTSNTSTTKTSTTTQLGTLLTNIAAVNAFISTVTTNIVSSGVTATEFIETDTPYRQKIEALLARGNGTQPYAWGVYEDREFYASQWAGATPTTITYQRTISEAAIYDSAGGEVAFWDVRPNAVYQVQELLDIAPVATQQDAAARFYVARVTCSISEGQMSLTLEPEQGSDLAAIMITKYL